MSGLTMFKQKAVTKELPSGAKVTFKETPNNGVKEVVFSNPAIQLAFTIYETDKTSGAIKEAFNEDFYDLLGKVKPGAKVTVTKFDAAEAELLNQKPDTNDNSNNNTCHM